MKLIIIVGIIIVGVFFIVLFPLNENEVSKQVTGKTINDFNIPIPDTNNNQQGKSPTLIDIECNSLYPNGFGNVILDYNKVLESGNCFPIENLDIQKCEKKKLLLGDILEICVADIIFYDRDGVRAHGITTDT